MKLIKIFVLILIAALTAVSQVPKTAPMSQRLADTLMNRIWVDDGNPPGIPRAWTYEQGVQLKAIEQLWYASGDPKYFKFIKSGMDFWFDKEGHLKYDADEY